MPPVPFFNAKMQYPFISQKLHVASFYEVFSRIDKKLQNYKIKN